MIFSANSSPSPLVKKSKLSLTTRRNLMGFWFLLPFLIGFLFIFIPSFIEAFRFGFNHILKTETGYSLEYKGFEYYNQALFVDPDFVRGVFESIGSMLVNVLIIIIYSLLIATLLNRDIKGKGIYRALLFLPVVISTGIITKVDGSLLAGAGSKAATAGEEAASGEVMGGLFSSADISSLISSLNIDVGVVDIVISAANNVYSIITTSGVQLIIFLAGLQSISPSIYESATVEGCTWWEGFWKITIPMISPLILVNLVYTVVDSFTRSSNAVMENVYGLISGISYESASARAFFYLSIVSVILIIIVAIANRFVFYENK